MDKVSVLAITKNGIRTALAIKESFPSWRICAPAKFSDGDSRVEWFECPTSAKTGELFKESEALVCIFSLGAVIRLVAPHMRDKKTDAAVVVIDDGANFVISALSGHLGGANRLAERIAREIGATPVITTAADVNRTIPVDLLGREFGWEIDDDATVTRVSALVVNGESIGVYQDAGRTDWWSGKLPENIAIYGSLEEAEKSGAAGILAITDRIVKLGSTSVTYRPKTLVVGVGLHQDTKTETIRRGLAACLEKYSLSPKSVARLASIRKPKEVGGLADLAGEMGVPLEYIDKERLAGVSTPNPSRTVQSFEGTPSVAEAAAILVSGGELIVEKQKFPPDLTIAIARMRF